MAKGSSYAVPATPSRGEDRADYNSTSGTEDLVTTGRSVCFKDTEFDHDAKDEDDYVDDELEDKAPVQESDLHEDADVFVTKGGGVKSLSRNLADEFEGAGKPEPAHDDIDELNDDLNMSSTMTRGASQLTTKENRNRPPINGDIPVANKTLGQCLSAMLDTSSWIQLFAPKVARQVVWAELVEELRHPVNSTSTSQVAEDTVSLLMAMSMEAYAYPSSTALAVWTASEAGTELRRKSESSEHSVTEDTEEDHPSSVRLSRTVAIFPCLAHGYTKAGEPLDESENSMQWLRGFVYEMKALSRKTKRTWSLRSDKFINYYCSLFSQSASTRYYRAKQSEKERIRGYLKRRNGYARSANIKFERSDREAKENVIHFLETPDEYSNDYSNDDPIDIYEGDEADQDECDSDCGSRDEMQVISVHKTMDNSQVDLIKVDSDLQLNLDRDSTIAAADAQVHDFGKCEAFDELAKILRTNVDKKNVSPELQKLVFTDLVIDAECVYAFIGQCKWPEDSNNNSENEKNVEFNGELNICEANEAAPIHAKTVQSLPGELNDVRTSILLDTGANVSIITTELERRLRLDPILEHVKAKVTLGWNTVYEFEFWVMDHSGSEVVLGTDFMIPAGVRLDLFNATAKLPGEEIVPLVKSLSADNDSAEGMHVTGGSPKSLQIPARGWIEFRLQKRKPSLGTHDGWVRRTAALIPTIIRFRKGQPTLVRLINITDRVVYCPAHLDVIAWVPRGFMPKQAGYVPIDSRKYEQWQVFADAGSHDETWFKLEFHGEEKSPEAAVADPENTFMCVMHVLSTEGNDDPVDDDYAVHEANYISLEDYAQELNPSFVGDQQRRLDEVLKKHEAIMIWSGNALPPPAYGVVCDIDVQRHALIKPRAMRIPLRHLQKLYELLKGLLNAGLITSSDSPWASPIVIVLKKNGQDIRLCIDYKMANAVTAIMEYAIPLVDDLLPELNNYLWFCSLDAASGFWAIMMTMRA
ncbi:hypothetical protein PHMEG_00025759, partial [Phytophthora megakarya]